MNIGDAPAVNVRATGSYPSGRAGDYVPRTCLFRTSTPRATRPCYFLDERTLSVDRLRPGERMSVRLRFRTDKGPCQYFETRPRYEVTADGVAKARAEASIRVAKGVTDRPRCRTPEARLLAMAPDRRRDSCAVKIASQPTALAEIRCSDVGEVRYAQYLLFRTRGDTAKAYERRVRAVGKEARRPCASDSDGEGDYYYARTSRPRGRYMCWENEDGTFIEWTDLELRVYAYGVMVTSDPKRIYRWFLYTAGPFDLRGRGTDHELGQLGVR